MSEFKKKIHAANAEYVLKKEMAAHPERKFAILTCMDARMDPVRFAGLADDCYVVRNAGGRATEDAIRSLIVSAKMLGTEEWFVIHHTECGMSSFTNEEMGRLLAESLGRSVHSEAGWKNVTDEAGAKAQPISDFHPFTDAEASLIEDVRTIRMHPQVSRRIPIHGYMYDIRTGELCEVAEASAIGAVTE